MLSTLLSARSILLAIFMLMAGGGFMGALVGIRLQDSGRDPVLIGLVATAYFGGLALGSLRVGRIIDRVGHIRAFAAFVALLSASTLTYSVHQNIAIWGVLRFVDGLCLAGVYVCLESWLSDRSDSSQRGSALAAYMIALYAGQALGQFLLNLSASSPGLPFVAASILISLAIVPIALTRSASPSIEPAPPLSVRRLYAISPLGFVGAGITGLVLGAFYGLGAVYARQLGMGIGATAAFMSAVIAGGVALQWPLGWLSDRLDRRRVIAGTFVGTAAIAALIAAAGVDGPALQIMGAVFGGLSFALYPLCVAHANDHVAAHERVGASGGLVLVYSAGAAVGPLAGALFMSGLGSVGLFAFIAACAGAAAAFALWRFSVRASVPGDLQHPYQARPRTTPMSATLDPLAPEPGVSLHEALNPPIVSHPRKDAQ
jgi:MFS family permease